MQRYGSQFDTSTGHAHFYNMCSVVSLYNLKILDFINLKKLCLTGVSADAIDRDGERAASPPPPVIPQTIDRSKVTIESSHQYAPYPCLTF